MFNRPDSRWFREEYVERTHTFFDRYGPRTVVLAPFVPIVRTFTPVMAGVGRMRYRTFVAYNLVGALAWGVGVTLLGYWLGGLAFVRDHLEVILVTIVAVSFLPVSHEVLRSRRSRAPVEVDGPGPA